MHDIDDFTRKMMPVQAEITLRHAFLEIGDADIALLKEIHARLQQKKDILADSFYEHLLQFPFLRALLTDADTIGRLKQTQAAYFNDITGGEYGLEYVRNRLRVGVVHQRIGLEPQWYIGAYRKYLSELAAFLQHFLKDDPDKFLPTYDAVLKIVCFDMSLAMDTYIQSDRQEILRLKHYAEQIIGSMPTGMMVIDKDRKVRTMNRAIRAMFGVGEERVVENASFASLVSSQLLMEHIEQGLAEQSHQSELVITISTPEKKLRYLRCTIFRSLLDEQNLLLLSAEDITEPMQARADLYESEERFRAAFGHAAVGLAHVSQDGRWLRVNQKLQDIVGYTEQELQHLTFQDITPVEDRYIDREELERLQIGKISSYAREKRYIHKKGHLVWVKVTVAPMQVGHRPTSFISVIEDISQRKQIEGELRHLVNHDSLTGLPNRLLLLDRLSQTIVFSHRAGKHVAVLFIDLDRFKNINDSLGHDAGNDVIIEVGRRLSQSIREGDTVARLGGDEFAVVLSEVAQEDKVALIAQKILDALSVPMDMQGHELSLAASIGISLFPKDGDDSPTLLRNADAAMYQAKEAGRGNFQFYAQEMNARTLDRLKLEAGLRHALERNEFVLHYQPQMDISSGEIVGVEALLRWQPPGKPMLAPNNFISIAEETGLIVPIGEWVLRAACAQHVAWKDAGFHAGRMAVNLSARQFKQQELDKTISRILQETGCSAACLELEITESVIMEKPETATETLQKLSNMGVQLSIDDFGTGYSSLSYLKRFPIHSLKIDQSFVRDITTDADDAAIAKAVIALAHSMKLTVIAEGVETVEQLNFLREQQCDHMQGYYFSRPLAPAQLLEFLGAK
jgi:diguanylate cyclase (GGDEF)-like protein/PAS domain S-box-containing protein